MAKQNLDKKRISDLEECRNKIQQLLREYNCRIHSCDDWSNVYIEDQDTQETIGEINPITR